MSGVPAAIDRPASYPSHAAPVERANSPRTAPTGYAHARTALSPTLPVVAMSTATPDRPWLTHTLGLLLLAEALTAAIALIHFFPHQPPTTLSSSVAWLFGPPEPIDRALMILALLSGALGSTLHTMPSFAAFVGDRKLDHSWVWWYVLRAPVGAILGFIVYVAIRGGVLTIDANDSSADINPYGVISIAALAGWFSKKASDKLSEVLDIALSSRKPAELTGKLDARRPVIDRLTPATLPAAQGGTVVLVGKDIATTASAELAGKPLPITRNGDELTVIIPPALLAPGKHPLIVIQSPAPDALRSESAQLTLT